MTKTKAEKKLDTEIDKLYRENCSNIVVNIMDIPRIFAVAKQAHKDGFDMKESIINFVNSIRQN